MSKQNTKYKSRKDEEKQSNLYLQMFDVPGAHYLCFDFILIYDDRFLWGSDAYTIACHFVLCTLARSFYALLGILRMRQNCNKINVSVNVAYTQRAGVIEKLHRHSHSSGNCAYIYHIIGAKLANFINSLANVLRWCQKNDNTNKEPNEGKKTEQLTHRTHWKWNNLH